MRSLENCSIRAFTAIYVIRNKAFFSLSFSGIFLPVVFYRYLETLVDTERSELKNWQVSINIKLTISTGEHVVLVDNLL